MTRILQALRHGGKVTHLFGVRHGRYSDEHHLAAATEWLLSAQATAGHGGYARAYHLVLGWRPACAETTGAIVPSLLETYRMLGDQRLYRSAAAALRWLKDIQRDDGSFAAPDGRRPGVSATGQVLAGFNHVQRHFPHFLVEDAQRRAAAWLASVQADDGGFERHGHGGRPRSGDVRAGAALIDAGQQLDEPRFVAAGLRNLRWTLARQADNGFFRHAARDDGAPFLHTLMQVLAGLLDVWALTGEQAALDGARRFADGLLARSRDDGVPFGRYDEQYRPRGEERCLPGLAQWSAVCQRLATLGLDAAYARQARASLDYLKTHQYLSHHPHLHGGLPGSDPVHGRYLRLAIPNWGVRAFIDALLAQIRRNMPQPAH